MEISVGELIAQLSVFNRDAQVVFGGGPHAHQFYRLKHRGQDPTTSKDTVQLEFNQSVYRDSAGCLVVEEA